MKLALIGKNISYSFSASYFKQKFEREKITTITYENIDITDSAQAEKYLKNPQYLGFNVTIPFKQEILQLLDSYSPEAQAIGAVNTIEKKGDLLIGHNTDWIGFWKSLSKNCDTKNIKRALILGDGGAAQAIKFALQTHGILYNTAVRKPKNNDYQIDKISAEIIKEHQLIINTTPVGTFPDVSACLQLPYEAISATHIIFDLIYNPQKTKFLEICEKQGATIINGHQMLQIQADEAWKIWKKNIK